MTAIPVLPARRADLQDEIVARTGIDEAMIRRLVETFYGRIRQDELLGPIFDARIANWPAHLARMCDFWSSVALMSGRYHGQPMAAHIRLPVDDGHFAHWLGLFEAVAREVCPAA
ncbi:MAG: group III truncated hemoglobin, partial [Alphaproteobacteria bacterium]|nr:group III truncated hemoglobin [Alphaproteobacteria bacterium]